jgi:hypothetical protein
MFLAVTKWVSFEHPKHSGAVKMGYSNKRKRSKRQRTKTLNAIQNRMNFHREHGIVVPSDSSSSDKSEHTQTIYSTLHSHIASEDTQNVPRNIFLNSITSMSCEGQVDVSKCETLLDSAENAPFSRDDFDTADDYREVSGSSSLGGDISNDEADAEILSACTSSSSEDSVISMHSHCDGKQHHSFDQLTRDEIASFKIMSLLDSAGAPRICYDRLIALLKNLSKTSGFEVKRALTRDTLLRRLGRKYKTRPRIQSTVINNQEVFRFSFQDMLQDLLHHCTQHLHIISPFGNQGNLDKGPQQHELWNTQWMKDTFALKQYENFDALNDIMLPIILYMDKTGTDVNQRYSLEPVLFTTAAIPRDQRESRYSWRHLGFIPQKQNGCDEDALHSLQSYHNSLLYLLDGLRDAQKCPPTVTVRLKCGNIIRRKAILPVMVVMGDQLSQDTLCGRLKSNSGGAGRVHRSCMCSYLNVDDPYHVCKAVNISTLQYLTRHAMISDNDVDLTVLAASNRSVSFSSKDVRTMKAFLQKKRTMFRSILRHPFTTHPIENAFNDIDFGSWTAGIHDATFDDFMHSVEAGMITYIAETVYAGLTKKEKDTVEDLTRPLLGEHRCSVTSNYPRWRIQPGFSRQTLMTSGERVGSILALSLSLQHRVIRETIRQAHHRQTQKYLDLSTDIAAEKDKSVHLTDVNSQSMNKSQSPPLEFYLDQHMHTLDEQAIQHTVEHMIRHGFQMALIDELDPFQINQLVWHCSDIFKNTQYPENYPSMDMDGSYKNLGQVVEIPKEQMRLVKFALQIKPCKLIDKRRLRRVEGTVGKHLLKKVHKKGEGSTAAVLTSNMETLVVFLEYVLCYHAFCKYSWSLPVHLQRNYENIIAGNRYIVEYFQKLIYRGNQSVDSRFPKIHAQRRMGENIARLNTVMNFCCETGERLLKTEAKGISRTAQQRGNNTFLTQTMSRVQERSVLDSVALFLEERDQQKNFSEPMNADHFGRTYPHFIFDSISDEIYAVNRKNESYVPDKSTGCVLTEVKDALKRHEPDMSVFNIYNEVVLRDNSRLRASPNYHKAGPWYDYVNVAWDCSENGIVETYLLPAKCLCFYAKANDDGSINEEMMALVHTVDQHSVGRVAGYSDTLLTRHYKMQFDNKGTPVTHVVPVATIDSAIRCFPHVRTTGLFNAESPGITYLLPRNHWAYMWIAMNDVITESNASGRGKLNALCNPHWLELVRERYRQKMNEQSDIDNPPNV